MKKLKKIEGSCAVIALHYGSGVDEETVLNICKFHGFTPEKGMEDHEWKEAARELGIKMRSSSMKDVRLSQFISKNKTGLFLMGTHDHLFILDNGIIIDPREKMEGRYPGLGRIIKQAWRVEK